MIRHARTASRICFISSIFAKTWKKNILLRVSAGKFCWTPCRMQFAKGMDEGVPVLEIHSPACGPLDIEECKKSIEAAKKFFARYYPEFVYQRFTCHSWLLDSTLDRLLPENSNIRKFKAMFQIQSEEPSDAILRYVFRWDTNRENLMDMPCSSSFARQVREAYAKKLPFHEGYGSIQK